ncbi:MAG: hypothetical protein AAB011_05395 [Candidatus Eisenbacteria bacterium]
MGDNDYDKAYEAGRSGGGFTGGNSIDYAGYAAGERMRANAESQTSGGGGGGGGGGGAINFKGKVVLVGLGFGMLGMFWGFLSETTWLGGIVGFVIGFVFGATLRLILAAVSWVLRLFGRIFPFVLPIVVGFVVGAGFGGVASDRMHTPREATMIQYGVAGAAILLVLWFLRRLLARKRSA